MSPFWRLQYGGGPDLWKISGPLAKRNKKFILRCQAVSEYFGFHSMLLVVDLPGCVTLFSTELVSVHRV
jgi:hypothetical protein